MKKRPALHQFKPKRRLFISVRRRAQKKNVSATIVARHNVFHMTLLKEQEREEQQALLAIGLEPKAETETDIN